MRLDYFLYMAEAEGHDNLVNTRTARINAAVKDFVSAARAGKNINSGFVQEEILSNHNLDNITEAEKDYIARQVNNLY